MVAELCIWLAVISFCRIWANVVFALMIWMKEELRRVNWTGERTLATVEKGVYTKEAGMTLRVIPHKRSLNTRMKLKKKGPERGTIYWVTRGI